MMKTRTVDLLQKLRAYKYPIKAEQLAAEYHVSKRTIRQDVLEANSWLKTQGLSEIKSLRNQGFLLHLNKEEEKQLEKRWTAFDEGVLSRSERLFELLLAIAYEEKPVFLNHKEESFMVSKSTMDEDIRRLRAKVLKYGIEIISCGKQGLMYKGAERSIRTMLYDLINKNLGKVDFYLNSEVAVTSSQKIFYRYFSVGEIERLEKIYSKKLIRPKDEIYKKQLLLFMLIWIQRVRKHEFISELNWKNFEDEQANFASFIEQIRKEFCLHEVPQVECQYIRFMMETFDSRDISNSIEWVQAQILTIQLIQNVEEITTIPFHLKEELLFENLYKHVAALIVRIKNNAQVINPLKESIRTTYETIYQAVVHFIPTIEEMIGGTVVEDEVAFLVIHFSTIVSAMKQNLSYFYKAVVVCNHGMATGNLLAENLKEKFPQIEIVAVLSAKESVLVDKLDIDLIFTTLQLPCQRKPILVIDPILTENSRPLVTEFLKTHHELQRLKPNNKKVTKLFTNVLAIIEESGGKIDSCIYAKLERLFEKNKLEITKREIRPMLKDILTDSHILIQKQAEIWQEAIEVVAKPLIKESIIETCYVNAMIQAVESYGAYIVIGKHLALAHARPEDGVNKLGVSVATLKNPINFGNNEMDPVKIIFCLAAVDSYSHLSIMKELISLINDEKKLNQLIQCSKIETFKTLLFK
ncbi:transcription antiterminator BglG [Enterococcus ratti]|uniref:Transcription antiterminator BglG n=2 Tax=Enterococcus ratti TaxID=150033 RepID=A0A1L8WQP2_9ENTE|nr:transcription antiterminator BglG [Enterococcus ratti]